MVTEQMNNQADSAQEKFIEEFLEIAFPEWMRSNKKSHDFRGFVLDKHMILEHLLDLLIVAHFFGKIRCKKSELFRNSVLAYMGFAKKVKVLEELKLVDKELRGLIFKVNAYRVAQSHIKQGDPRREPTEKNFKLFQEFSTEAHAVLASKIMIADSDLQKRVRKISNQGGFLN
ncbi:hypothetical protein L6258_01230 [Candidatus Parcubacteria bacterium]|nr:hypothetical protein [Candidatus Parcubacteria bacterium]